MNDAAAILKRPLEENHPRRKRKGTSVIVSYSMPHDTVIEQFYAIDLHHAPIRVPAGATISLHITMPKARRR